MQKDNYDSISRRNFLEVLLLSSLGLFLSACNRLMGNSPIPSPMTFESSETPTKVPSTTKQPTPTRDTPTTTPEPTNTQKPALTPTEQLNLDEFVEKFGLDKIGDIRRDYQRTGNISVPIKDVTKEAIEMHNIWFAFREDQDGDLYLLDYNEKLGWVLGVDTLPIGKDNLSDLFRYYEVRTGDLVLVNKTNEFIYKISNFDVYTLATPNPEPSGGGDGGLPPNGDADGDGVLNKDDQCPHTPGIPSRYGCPAPTPSLGSD